MAEKQGFFGAFRDLLAALDAWGEPYLILGGWAVAAHDYVRATRDIDLTLALDVRDVQSLLDHFGRWNLRARGSDPAEFARRARVLLLVHEPSGVEVDVSLAAIPFELDAIAHAETRNCDGHSLRVPRLEDLLVFKLVASRPRDLDDVEQLLRRNPRPLDLARVDRILAEFCEVLEDESRLHAWKSIQEKLGRTGA